MKTIHKLRISASDAHYADDLVDGAKVLQFFGDVATELLIRNDGDEGLFRAYDSVEFLAPVKAGDFLEVEGELVKIGNTSRQFKFEARKVIQAKPTASNPHAAEVLSEPVVCVKATGTCVVVK